MKSSTLGPGHKYDTIQYIVAEEIIYRKTKCHSKYHVATILVHYDTIFYPDEYICLKASNKSALSGSVVVWD